jgi:hypothetical protein
VEGRDQRLVYQPRDSRRLSRVPRDEFIGFIIKRGSRNTTATVTRPVIYTSLALLATRSARDRASLPPLILPFSASSPSPAPLLLPFVSIRVFRVQTFFGHVAEDNKHGRDSGRLVDHGRKIQSRFARISPTYRDARGGCVISGGMFKCH